MTQQYYQQVLQKLFSKTDLVTQYLADIFKKTPTSLQTNNFRKWTFVLKSLQTYEPIIQFMV